MKATIARLGGLPAGLGILGRSLALVAGVAPATVGFSLLLVLGMSALSILQVWLAKAVVDALVSSMADRALMLAGVYVLTVAIPPALEPLQQALNAWLEDRATREVDRRLMEAGARMVDLGRIERPEFHDELQLVRTSVYYGPSLLRVIWYGLGGAVTLAGVLALLGRLHPLLPLALALVSAPRLIAERRTVQLTYQAMSQRSKAAREMHYCARVTTEPDAAKEIRVFGLGGFFLARFRDRLDAALREVTGVRVAHLRTSALFAGLQALVIAGGFWYVAAQAGAGRLGLGDLALYFNAIIQVEGLLGMLPFWFGYPYEALQYLRGLFRLLDSSKPQIVVAPRGDGPAVPTVLSQGVELCNLSFCYPESTAPVLGDISFRLPAGKVTALVGANGAGKSTLVKLLTRMYDPTGGKILLDGAPLAEYDLPELRSRIAVAYQDFAHFSLTLRENIAVGAVAGGNGDGQVEEAARLSGADEVASRLEHRYDTQLTRRFEGGVDLSGGEWQKVALARSFMRDAALVILDEPTSALDADAEYRLFERFRELVQGRTALIISHRFSTVRMADQIVVLENGHIVESGSHVELLERGGRYATLFEMQAGRYR